jgi:hypothetical protein
MRDFSFEYTDAKFTLKLLVLCFLSLVVFLIAMAVTVDLIGVIGSLIFVFGVPLAIFFLNRKKIKKHGTANIHDSYSEFTLADSTDKIVYSDIESYQVERYNGTHLKIKFKDGRSFKVQANSNFCNADKFDAFCREFEDTIQQFKATNHVELTRMKSMFEKVWMLPFLIIITAFILGAVVFEILMKRTPPTAFYTTSIIVTSLWIGYFNARKRRATARSLE